jgi:AraC-like DNA-binding protein
MFKMCTLLLMPFAGLVHAQDTTLTRQFQLPYPVNCVAVDADGTVIIGSARGREVWTGDGFKVVDPFDFDGVANWNGAVLSHEEFSVASGTSPHAHFRQWEPWLPVGGNVQLTAAEDASQTVWVCDGKRLYNYKIGNRAPVLLPDCSVRGLAFFGEHWIASTYDGMYLDGERICPEVPYNDGNILVRGDSLMAFGQHLVVVHYQDMVACEVYNDRYPALYKGGIFNFQAGADWEGHLMIGNSFGLGEWADGQFKFVHEGFDVRHLVPTDVGLFVLTADQGVHVWDGRNMRFTGIEASCSGLAPWTKGRWVLATQRGLGIWSPETNTLDYLTTQDGLTSHSICAVHVDAQECIWFSSYSGILRYSEAHGIIEIHHPDVEFNRGSFAIGADGALYFGSVQGIFKVIPGPLKFPVERSPWLIWGLTLAIAGAVGWIAWLVRQMHLRRQIAKAQQAVHEREAFLLRVQALVLEGLPHSSVFTVSEKMGLSERQFYRIAAELGIKPGQIIREAKLKRAEALLSSGEHTMQAVAAEVGYTVSYLRRIIQSKD